MLKPEVRPARLSEVRQFVTTLLTTFVIFLATLGAIDAGAKYLERRDAAERAGEHSRLAYTLSWAREVAWAGALIAQKFTPADFHTDFRNLDYGQDTNRALGSSGGMSINGTTTITGDLIVRGKIIHGE